MNELDKQLAKLVEKGIAAAEQSGEFIIDQAPDLVHQFYLWHTYKAIFFIILSIALYFSIKKIAESFGFKTLTEGMIGKHYVLKNDKFYLKEEYSNDRSIVYTFSRIVSFSAYIIPVPILLTNVYNLIFMLVAPKIYIINYFINY